MKLSIIIPVYNEIQTIEALLGRVREISAGRDVETIVVDDGSTDGTTEYLQTYNNEQTKIISLTNNQGKGNAIRTAIPHATGDAVAVQDADLEYDPEELFALLKILETESLPAIYGSRFLGTRTGMTTSSTIGNRGLTAAMNLLFRTSLTDLCTCFKMVRRDILCTLPLQSTGFEFCAEVTAHLAKRNVPIREVPITYHARSRSQGKKIRWSDGVISLFTLIRCRFSPLS
ncbi:MAG: glycosyltransferase family 2 protein [Patescibacteria group bacterium]